MHITLVRLSTPPTTVHFTGQPDKLEQFNPTSLDWALVCMRENSYALVLVIVDKIKHMPNVPLSYELLN